MHSVRYTEFSPWFKDFWRTEVGEYNLNIDDVMNALAAHFGVTRAELALSGKRPIQRRREVAVYFAHRLTMRSVPQIGEQFGMMHHTNVLFTLRKVRQRMVDDPAFAAEIEALEKSLLSVAAGFGRISARRVF